MIEESKNSENYAFVNWDKVYKEVKIFEKFEGIVRPERVKAE